MSQSGLAIPCDEGATLSYFKHIYVDIGDSQSLSDNLSTFSGHMANIASILTAVGGRDLVLLDEVGTGTSPKEGEAIAFAVISYLIKKHAFTLVSSHFEGLKAYALSHEEITNASMVFDEEKLLPTYKLKMGLPGESYGLVVAKRFGLPDEVVATAKAYASSHEETSVTDAIKKLGQVTKETEDEKAKVLAQEAELAKKEAALSSQEAALKLRQDHYLSDVEAKKNEMLEAYKDQMDEILHSVERNDVKLHEVISAKKQLEDLEEESIPRTFHGSRQSRRLRQYSEPL
jgi:DNA mismatch repair protein MutS2